MAIRRADAILNLSRPASTLVLALIVATLSYVSAGAAGVLVFRRWARPARLGFWNLLTLLGLILVIHRRSVADLYRVAPAGDSAAAQRADARRFVMWFVVLYLVGTIVVQTLARGVLAA